MTKQYTQKTKSIISSDRSGDPDPVDIQVGFLLRERRILLGLSQMQLADMLGISFQQLQKYETGINRISCSRLLDIVTVLDTNIEYFFDNIPQQALTASPRLRQQVVKLLGKSMQDKALDRELLELIKSYRQIPDKEKRTIIISMCHAMAQLFQNQQANNA